MSTFPFSGSDINQNNDDGKKTHKPIVVVEPI